MKRLSKKEKHFLRRRSRREVNKKYRDRKFRLKKLGENTYLKNLEYYRQNLRKSDKSPEETYISLKPQNSLSIKKNSSQVVDFISRLKKYAKPIYAGYNVKIDLEDVKDIDTGSICLLLSVVEELAFYKVKVVGNIPADPVCEKFFVESGFLKYMSSISKGKYLTSEAKSLILKRGRDKTRNQDIGETIKTAVKNLTGKAAHYPPIFSLVQEISGNSVEHAYENNKEHWLFATNYKEEEGKVIFTFADNGYGILKTLKRKLSQRFFDDLQLSSDSDILKGAFTKKYNSRHIKQINRNKGLPLIKKIQSQGEVNNLFVISNGVFLYLDDYSKVSLNKSFSGTFYYWELDKQCLEQWQNSN